MSTLDQIREGFSRALESLSEGWREFRELAGDALTRFHPKHDEDDAKAISRIPRWGLLAADVTDDKDKVVVTLEVPGLDPNDFEVEARGDILVVRGEKKVAREKTEGSFHIMERAYGAFERAIRLPAPVVGDDAKASYRAGVLTVTLPKATGERAGRIAVTAE